MLPTSNTRNLSNRSYSRAEVPFRKIAASLSKSLAAQGWKSDGSDLVTPQSAILNLSRGDATLTIMVKPSGSGSQTTVFAQGLDWEKKQ